MYDLFPRGKKRDSGDLNIVPILDMFVCVIFFLLLGTSFTQLTKLTLPPSSVSTSADPVPMPPLSPRLTGTAAGGQLHLVLSWEGATPGQVEKTVEGGDTQALKERESRSVASSNAAEAELRTAVSQMVSDFVAAHPGEKTLKVGLGPDIPYQHLVSLMDGAREKMPDLVLTSYSESEKRGL